LLGIVIAAVHTALLSQNVVSGASRINEFLGAAAITNFVLFFFNLLPVPPLDGGHVAQSFLPYRYREQYEGVARYAPFALLALMCIPQLRVVFVWPATHVAVLIYDGFGRLFGIA
jgi:Zn-dependent protease